MTPPVRRPSTLVPLGGALVNIAAIASLVPIDGGGCDVHLTGGPKITVSDASPAQVAALLARHEDDA